MNQKRGVIYTALSGTMYGLLGFFGAQLLQAKFTVPAFLFWRFCIAALTVALMGLVIRDKKEWKMSALLSSFLMGGVFYSGSAAFYFFASTYIGTGLAMVIFFSYPALVILLARLSNEIQLTPKMIISMVLILIGLLLLSESNDYHFDWRGIVLAIIAAVCYGVYVYVSKKQINQLPSLLATGVVSIGSMTTFLVISLVEKSFLWPKSLEVWGNVLGIGVICTALPILFLLEGLKSLDASKASLISVLEPVVTVIVGASFLGEVLTQKQILGVIVVLFGATLIQIEKAPSLKSKHLPLGKLSQ